MVTEFMVIINGIILDEAVDSVQTAVRRSVLRFAWGNSTLKTWFITKSNKAFLPKGCKLLFKILGKETNEPTHTIDTYPKLDDVIADVDGFNIKVAEVIWI